VRDSEVKENKRASLLTLKYCAGHRIIILLVLLIVTVDLSNEKG